MLAMPLTRRPMMQPHPPLTGLDKLTLAGFGGLLAATAGLLTIRSRWMSAVAAAVATFAVGGAAQSQEVRDMLGNPSEVGDFASTVLLLLAGATGAIGGIATTVQRSRTPRTTATPR